jgi:hypothetical protein
VFFESTQDENPEIGPRVMKFIPIDREPSADAKRLLKVSIHRWQEIFGKLHLD